MAISSVSTPSQALASYAAQLQAAQSRGRPQEAGPRTQEQSESSESKDRVTLSAQSAQGSSQTDALQASRKNEAARTANTQAVDRKQEINPQETRSAASKSVTQALEAYVQTSLV